MTLKIVLLTAGFALFVSGWVLTLAAGLSFNDDKPLHRAFLCGGAFFLVLSFTCYHYGANQ